MVEGSVSVGQVTVHDLGLQMQCRLADDELGGMVLAPDGTRFRQAQPLKASGGGKGLRG
jgi:hypothetical protein